MYKKGSVTAHKYPSLKFLTQLEGDTGLRKFIKTKVDGRKFQK